MLFLEQHRQVTIHLESRSPVKYTYKPNWVLGSEPLSWGEDIDVIYCDKCFGDELESEEVDALQAVLVEIRTALQPALNEYRLDRIKYGAPVIDKGEVCKRCPGMGTTRLQNLINEGRFPDGMTIGNRRIWLEEEVAPAYARIVAEDTKAGVTRPLNRYEKRAAAKSPDHQADKATKPPSPTK